MNETSKTRLVIFDGVESAEDTDDTKSKENPTSRWSRIAYAPAQLRVPSISNGTYTSTCHGDRQIIVSDGEYERQASYSEKIKNSDLSVDSNQIH